VLKGDISECTPIVYPPPQPPLSTDLLTSLTLTATNHAEDQPVHLRLPPGLAAHRAHVQKNVGEYAGLLGRACPAAVYEYVDASENDKDAWEGKKLVINSQVRVIQLAYSVCDISTELYTLQVMRYQSTNTRHHMDSARRRGWPKIQYGFYYEKRLPTVTNV
jgi:Electron transfer flavoprotein-ubiquinone oxidoreductase, 4Fe-4S